MAMLTVVVVMMMIMQITMSVVNCYRIPRHCPIFSTVTTIHLTSNSRWL